MTTDHHTVYFITTAIASTVANASRVTTTSSVDIIVTSSYVDTITASTTMRMSSTPSTPSGSGQ